MNIDDFGLKASAYREGGEWKIQVEIPHWLFNDIILEAERSRNVTIIGRYPFQAWSSMYGANANGIQLSYEALVAIARFELVNGKKDEDA